jgi:hypothetical protein
MTIDFEINTYCDQFTQRGLLQLGFLFFSDAIALNTTQSSIAPERDMMTYRVGYICEQGQCIVIIPLDSLFGNLLEETQLRIISKLKQCSIDAGLKGDVVVFWWSGSDYSFIAPPKWHAFFKSLGVFERLLTNLNKTLTIS